MQGVAWSLMSFFTYYASIKQESQLFPALLRVWWFLSFLLSILCLTLDIMLLTGYGESTPSIWYDMLAFPMCTFLGFVALYGRTGVSSSSTSGIRQPLIVRDSPNEKLTTKYANANPFSLLTFSWLNPVLNVGSKNPLALDQVPYLTGNDTAQQSVLTFKTNWNVLKAESPPQNPSLAKTIFFSIWKEWSLNALFALAYTISSYAGPPLINLFVEYLGGNRHFHYEGYMLASAFIGIKLIESFARPLWFFGSHRLSLHIRAALTAAIYEKGLRLSNQVRQSHSSGEIINYASIDVHRVGDFAWFWHDIWLLPIQILLAFFILFKSLGLASLAGLAVTVASIVATKPLASLQKTFQGKIMDAKDERMKATSEALRNMRILKLHAWETKYMQTLLDLRTGECGWLWKYLYTKATINFIFWAAPTFVSAVTFFICVLAGVPLTAGKVLATLATFKILQEPIYLIPKIVSVVVQTKVSLYRIATFLEMEELQFSAVERTESDPSEATIEIEGGEFSWDPCSSTPVLSGINLQVRAGMKVAICGAVGSGKSSLISCILGEMLKISGTVKVRGTRAYVSQSPWIQSRTIQDNIIFGKEMDDIKYNTVLQACALNKDIEMFSYGDQTEIGERGINLSGGQKQRIQLARAIYQDKDIYLLDDPFSAVDAHTGTHLFTECLYGILSSKTILYVTHQVEFLPHADLILVMQGGKITQAGEYSDLLQAGTDFMRLVGSHHHALEIINAVKCSSSVTSMETGPCNGHNINTAYIGTRKTQKQSSTKQIDKGAQVFQKNNGDMASEDPVLRKEQIVKEEEKQKGSVSLQIYWFYLTAVYKGFLIIVILVAQISFQALEISSNYWIASRTPTTVDGKPIVGSLFPIILYIALVLGSSLCLLVRSAFLSKAALQTAQVYFTRMLSCIFHAPIAFFDATPTGRILNRVSTDQTEVDMTLPFNLGNLAFSVIQLLGVITVMSQVAREVFVISIPVLAMIIWYQHYYIATARELARLIGIQKAPIINHFAESISGASTIRAFDQENHFMATNLNLLDDYSRPQFHSSASQEWLGLRLNLLSNFIFAFCIVFLLNFPMDTIDPSIAGLAVTYGLNFTSLQFTLIWNLCCVENKMVSVERILQYCQIPNEGPLVVEETQPDCDWPSNGRVDLCNLQVRYRPHLPFILKGITCTIPGRTKVGVVGRTGSGKSTLVQALFRILEPSEGKIIIDGIDISVIGLHDLRSRLSIIPQDPIMFEGTIRVNLDPLEEHSDAKIWESLHKCQLGVVHEKEDKLNAWVTENGENWSMGQRQLICLGRVLLKKNRILVLDEATASVDTATDSVIQNIIRREFGDCTVITIAHRINTLIDSDLVLVLSDGRIAEYDSPSKLLQCSSSFAKLVGEYSARSSTVSNITTLLQKIG